MCNLGGCGLRPLDHSARGAWIGSWRVNEGLNTLGGYITDIFQPKPTFLTKRKLVFLLVCLSSSVPKKEETKTIKNQHLLTPRLPCWRRARRLRSRSRKYGRANLIFVIFSPHMQCDKYQVCPCPNPHLVLEPDLCNILALSPSVIKVWPCQSDR